MELWSPSSFLRVTAVLFLGVGALYIVTWYSCVWILKDIDRRRAFWRAREIEDVRMLARSASLPVWPFEMAFIIRRALWAIVLAAMLIALGIAIAVR